MAHPLTMLCVIGAMALSSACASYDNPENIEPAAQGDAYQAQYREPDVTRANAQYLRSADIERALLAEEFYTTAPRISVRVSDFASVTVGVSGAVFEPRAVEIGRVLGIVGLVTVGR